eukprot:5991821-Pleurochrysis_carterae.AAC.4
MHARAHARAPSLAIARSPDPMAAHALARSTGRPPTQRADCESLACARRLPSVRPRHFAPPLAQSPSRPRSQSAAPIRRSMHGTEMRPTASLTQVEA